MKRPLIVSMISLAIVAALIPSAFASDTSSPQLVDWTNTRSSDISNLDGQVKANFILSDDSEIELPKLLLKSATTTQMTAFATVRVIQKSGKLTSYEATAVVQKGQAARTWEWILYPLSDSLGNRSTTFGPGGSWNATVAIYNSEYTGETASCERAVTSWNTQIERLEAAEKKFFGYEDFSVLRLKFYPPIIKVDQTFCATKPVDLATVFGLANSATGLGVDLSEVIDRVSSKWQEAADKAASDPRIAAAKKKYSELNSEIDRLIKQYPSKQSEIELYKKKIAIFERIDQVNVTNVEPNLALIESKLVAMRSVYGKIARTITCTKGKLTKKVTDVNPKCPAGYKKK